MSRPPVGHDTDDVVSSLKEDLQAADLFPLPATPSYHPTSWPLLNTLLDWVEVRTHGRAGQVQKLVSYLLFGGIAAMANLLIFYVVFHDIALPVSEFAHNIIASACAVELSLIVNFIPNDYFTFRYMPGRSRSWWVRCVRYHITALSGNLLTVLLQLFFSHVLHIEPLLGEACAIILVLFYNYTFHHLFTYNHATESTKKVREA
jgi:putative flippase GtrA